MSNPIAALCRTEAGASPARRDCVSSQLPAAANSVPLAYPQRALFSGG